MGFRHGTGHGPESQHMMGFGNYGLFFIIMTGILLVVILLIVYKLINKNKQMPTEVETESTALTILKERYARGELSDEEFTHKKEVLNKE